MMRRIEPRNTVDGGMKMCKGLGIDLCGIERMEKLLGNSSFLERFFTENEISYIRSKGHYNQRLRLQRHDKT